ncbi:alpha/beta hydrolase, partial [Microbacterium hominis]|uniref:alpha/beta hydrolase n=1 Tax=Microbacterium hominis TaxID=162426 RepID=UPI00077C164D
MTLLMKLTVGALWLTSGRTRRDLSGAEYLSRVDPQRTFAPPPRDAGAFGRLTESRVAGSTVLRWQPHDHVVGRELIYLPGGGFVSPMVREHWWIVQRIMTATRAALTIAPYPLTPEHTVDEAEAFIDAVYDEVAHRPTTREIFVAGDSAGGNVATTLALRVRDTHRHPLDGLILLAPWVDPTMRTAGAWQRERRDPTLRCTGLRAAAGAWAGTRDLRDPSMSPI